MTTDPKNPLDMTNMQNKDNYSPFTKEEFQHLIVQAVKGAGEQSTEELQEVLNEAIQMKVSSLLLDEVMNERLVMFWSREQNNVIFGLPNELKDTLKNISND